MPSVPYIITGIRRRRREKSRSDLAHRLGRAGFGISLILGLVTSMTTLLLAGAYASLTDQLPSPALLPALLESPAGLLQQPTRLFDRTGEHVLLTLQNPAASSAQYVPLASDDNPGLPSFLIDATLVASTPSTWQEVGVWTEAMRNSGVSNLARRLVSELLLWDEQPGFRNTLRQRLLAWQVLSRNGEEKILEWYLNSAFYGKMVYGIDAAARVYFGKSATQLSLAEGALLAAVGEAPALNPQDAPFVARERQEQLLESMFNSGLIDAIMFNQARQEALEFLAPQEPITNPAPAFTSLVLEQISKTLSFDRIARGGFTVLTSLDYDLQLQIACTAENQLARLDNHQKNELLALDGSTCQAARLLPSFTSELRASSENIRTNIIVQEPTSAQILAMVGESEQVFNPAHLPGHAPGSILTPFIYLAAFTRGYTPASMFWDIPASIPEELPELTNPDGLFHGPVRLRMAMANNYLVPAIQLLAQMSPETVWRIAQKLGLISLDKLSETETLRLPLEGGEVTLLELSQAFSVFANQGNSAGQVTSITKNTADAQPLQPVAVLRVVDHQGKVWWDCQDQKVACQFLIRPLVSPQITYLVNNIMSDETARWQSLGHPNPLEIGRPASAKIGQTLDRGDTWAVGYTPDLLVAVWVGSDLTSDRMPLPTTIAAGLWHAAIQYASQDKPVKDWSIPSGIGVIQVCDPSGMLPSPICPTIVTEIFPSGSEPTHQDTLFRAFQVNRETGQLATVFSPAELIEERVYMVIPPEAVAWARQTELPTPPESYDLIGLSGIDNPNAQINSPAMFSSVHGLVNLQGSAQGQGFISYRLQFGEGLNPGTWVQIGQDMKNPVAGGQLGVWDTQGLNGLYALQLLVLFRDQSVETTTIQVTVDNQPPVVSLRYPVEGQHFQYPQDSVIILQSDVSDDLELSEVRFYVNNELLATRSSPPYVLPWDAQLGKHTFRVEAVDRAGNASEANLVFLVER